MKKTLRSVALPIALLGTAAAIAAGCHPESAHPSGSTASSSAGAAGSEITYEGLVAVLADRDEFSRARKLGELLPTLGPQGVPIVRQVLEQFASARIELGASDYELLMRYWALHDPEAASRYAYGMAPRGYRVGAIYATVRPWMQESPEEALTFLRDWGAEQGDYGAAVQIALVQGWYDSGKPGLPEYIHDLGPSFERQRALGAYLTAMIRARGPQEAVSWAEAVPEQDRAYQLEVFRVVGESLVPFDVEAAKRFCDAHCDGPNAQEVRAEIATRWALNGTGEGGAALEWLSTTPASDQREFAVRRTYAIWADYQREAALAWMKPHVDGEMPEWLRPALPIYVRELSAVSPEESLALVKKFFATEGRLYDHWTATLVRPWRQRDEAAAEAWIKTASLSPEVLEKIRAPRTPADELRIKREKLQQSIAGPAKS
jgi:hypothetical protein